MKSHAVSGPNKKKPNNPHPCLTEEMRTAAQEKTLLRHPSERHSLIVSMQLGHPSLGIKFPGVGNDLDQKMSLMPVLVSQRFPNFCCQVLTILPVAVSCSGPRCSVCQNRSHRTSSKLTLVSHVHMPLDLFALGVRKEGVKIKPANLLGVVQLCGDPSSPGMD